MSEKAEVIQRRTGINWATSIAMVVFHLGAIAALFTFSWTAVIVSVVLWWVCWQHLPETMPVERRQPFNPRFLARSYWDIFSSVLFQMKSGIVAFNFGGMFLFIAGAPVLLPVHLHLGPSDFAWLFVPAVSGIFLGALVANRLAGRMTFSRQIAIGYALMLAAVTGSVAYHSVLPPALPWTVLPMFFYNFGSSIINPSATLLALDLSGEPLSLDHGFPCRLIAPDRPGVLQTKWVARLEVVA